MKTIQETVLNTLDGVLEFVNIKHKDLHSEYNVFKELFVVCWSGVKKKVRDEIFYSRVDIELINEQVKLFYSAQDDVNISFDEDSFIITEYVALGLNDKTSYYPLEKVTITFFDNGYYKIITELLFKPPQYNKKMLHHIYNSNVSLLNKLKNGTALKPNELKDLENLPSVFMICFLNGFDNAKQLLIESKPFLKTYDNLSYSSFKEVMRVIRKMKYNH